jgi:hypothetical protein
VAWPSGRETEERNRAVSEPSSRLADVASAGGRARLSINARTKGEAHFICVREERKCHFISSQVWLLIPSTCGNSMPNCRAGDDFDMRLAQVDLSICGSH